MKKTADPEEDSITENSKRTLGLSTLKRILSMKKLKRTLSLLHLWITLSMKIQKSFGTLNDFCAAN